MNIEIKLKDPESCEGCPLLEENEMSLSLVEYCLHYGEEIPHGKDCYSIRPKRCIEENGL